MKKKKKVKIGDTLVRVVWLHGIPVPTGDRIIVTRENIGKFTDDTESEGVTLDFQSICDHLVSRLSLDHHDTLTKLSDIAKIYLPAVFSILLKEAAIMLDGTHTGHIRNSEEIWTVSLLDGKPHRTDPSKIISFRNFAAFRSKEDAEKALEALKCCVHDLYGEQKD